MFCFASRTLCGNSKIELKITDSEIFEDTYKGAASENKQSVIASPPSALDLYLYPCIKSFFSLFNKQSYKKNILFHK